MFCVVICVPVLGHATYKGLYIVGGSPRKGHLFQVYERVGVSLVLSI